MNFDPKRAEHESFAAYRERRAANNKAIKRHLHGVLLWNSQLGTARRVGKGYVIFQREVG